MLNCIREVSRNKSIELYNSIRELYKDKDISFINDKYISLYNRMVQSVCIDEVNIKTMLGSYQVRIDDIMDNYIFNLFIDYIIIKNGFNEDFDIVDILLSKDLGIIVSENKDSDGNNYKRIYFNIDDDISSMICSIKPDDFLLSIAMGLGEYYIDTGMCVKFVKEYINSFGTFESISSLIGTSRNLYDLLYNTIKDYKGQNGYFFREDICLDYAKLYLHSGCSLLNGPLTIGMDIINKYGLNDSRIRTAIKNNNISVMDNLVNINDIVSSVNYNMSFEYDERFLCKDDIIKAVDNIKELGNTNYTGCNTVNDICKLFNINYNSLVGKLLCDIELNQAIVLCLAERNRYRQGYFFYTYHSIKDVERNIFSTKSFLRKMIEDKEKI